MIISGGTLDFPHYAERRSSLGQLYAFVFSTFYRLVYSTFYTLVYWFTVLFTDWYPFARVTLGLLACFPLMYCATKKSAVIFRVGPGQFIVLNDSASPKMVVKIYFNFFRFF